MFFFLSGFPSPGGHLGYMSLPVLNTVVSSNLGNPSKGHLCPEEKRAEVTGPGWRGAMPVSTSHCRKAGFRRAPYVTWHSVQDTLISGQGLPEKEPVSW
jgi:hypothetical protein